MSIRDRTKAFASASAFVCRSFWRRWLAPALPPSPLQLRMPAALGACGALLMTPEEIGAWTEEVRAASNGAFQLNLWIPDPSPVRDPGHEARVREFLATWGPVVTPLAGDATPQDFNAQCRALLDARAPIVSSVMGLYPPDFVATLKSRGIAWFANVSTVAEARAAAAAGADVVIAQGMEAGGHRGCFDASKAETGDGGVGCSSPRRG